MALDIFSGLITERVSPVPSVIKKVFDRPQNVGHFIFVLNPEIFIGSDDYKARFLEWETSVLNASPAEGVSAYICRDR